MAEEYKIKCHTSVPASPSRRYKPLFEQGSLMLEARLHYASSENICANSQPAIQAAMAAVRSDPFMGSTRIENQLPALWQSVGNTTEF